MYDLINLFSLPPTVSRVRPLVDRLPDGKKCRRGANRLTISVLPVKNDLTPWLPRGLSDFSRTNYGGTTEGLRRNFGGTAAPPEGGDELNRARCFLVFSWWPVGTRRAVSAVDGSALQITRSARISKMKPTRGEERKDLQDFAQRGKKS